MGTTQRKSIRPLFGLGLLCALLFLLATLINALDGLVDLYERAAAISPWLPWLLHGLLGGFLLVALGFIAWWLLPIRQRSRQRVLDEPSLRAAVRAQADAGVDVSRALSELEELEARRHSGRVHIALFGETSSGKSSVIRALVPEASAQVDVLAGTTRQCQRYSWQTAGEDALELVDAPGFSHDSEETRLATEEAIRAHLVIYLCDGDLTQSEWLQIDRLVGFGKPMVLAVNKADQFREDELEAIRQQIAERFPRGSRPQVVGITAGGLEPITRIEHDGTEREELRPRRPRIKPLKLAIERSLSRDPAALTELRDSAVFQLAGDALDDAQRSHQRRAGERIIATHTRAAVVGALAALSPGSDLVIQGAIGTRLVRALCRLHDVRVREVDIEAVLRDAGGTSRKSSALVLAVAGNALKAFPGLGTVTGGLVHAVAYGLLFDAFGHALADSLRNSGSLSPGAVSQGLAERLDEDLSVAARRIARLALRRNRPDSEE